MFPSILPEHKRIISRDEDLDRTFEERERKRIYEHLRGEQSLNLRKDEIRDCECSSSLLDCLVSERLQGARRLGVSVNFSSRTNDYDSKLTYYAEGEN